MKNSKEFRLQLVDPAIGISLVLIPIAGFLLLFGIAFGGLALLSIKNPWLAGIYVFTALGGGGFLGFRAYKQWAIISAIVFISDKNIEVSSNGRELMVICYNEIKSYRYQNFNDSEELRITLQNNERFKIRANNKFAEVGDFAGMVSSFEACLSQLSNVEDTLIIKREKAFFEKHISTVLLIAFTILLLLVFWKIYSNHKSVPGSLIVSIGSYFTYLSGWLAAAEQRRQK